MVKVKGSSACAALLLVLSVVAVHSSFLAKQHVESSETKTAGAYDGSTPTALGEDEMRSQEGLGDESQERRDDDVSREDEEMAQAAKRDQVERQDEEEMSAEENGVDRLASDLPSDELDESEEREDEREDVPAEDDDLTLTRQSNPEGNHLQNGQGLPDNSIVLPDVEQGQKQVGQQVEQRVEESEPRKKVLKDLVSDLDTSNSLKKGEEVVVPGVKVEVAKKPEEDSALGATIKLGDARLPRSADIERDVRVRVPSGAKADVPVAENVANVNAKVVPVVLGEHERLKAISHKDGTVEHFGQPEESAVVSKPKSALDVTLTHTSGRYLFVHPEESIDSMRVAVMHALVLARATNRQLVMFPLVDGRDCKQANACGDEAMQARIYPFSMTFDEELLATLRLHNMDGTGSAENVAITFQDFVTQHSRTAGVMEIAALGAYMYPLGKFETVAAALGNFYDTSALGAIAAENMTETPMKAECAVTDVFNCPASCAELDDVLAADKFAGDAMLGLRVPRCVPLKAAYKSVTAALAFSQPPQSYEIAAAELEDGRDAQMERAAGDHKDKQQYTTMTSVFHNSDSVYPDLFLQLATATSTRSATNVRVGKAKVKRSRQSVRMSTMHKRSQRKAHKAKASVASKNSPSPANDELAVASKASQSQFEEHLWAMNEEDFAEEVTLAVHVTDGQMATPELQREAGESIKAFLQQVSKLGQKVVKVLVVTTEASSAGTELAAVMAYIPTSVEVVRPMDMYNEGLAPAFSLADGRSNSVMIASLHAEYFMGSDKHPFSQRVRLERLMLEASEVGEKRALPESSETTFTFEEMSELRTNAVQTQSLLQSAEKSKRIALGAGKHRELLAGAASQALDRALRDFPANKAFKQEGSAPMATIVTAASLDMALTSVPTFLSAVAASRIPIKALVPVESPLHDYVSAPMVVVFLTVPYTGNVRDLHAAVSQLGAVEAAVEQRLHKLRALDSKSEFVAIPQVTLQLLPLAHGVDGSLWSNDRAALLAGVALHTVAALKEVPLSVLTTSIHSAASSTLLPSLITLPDTIDLGMCMHIRYQKKATVATGTHTSSHSASVGKGQSVTRGGEEGLGEDEPVDQQALEDGLVSNATTKATEQQELMGDHVGDLVTDDMQGDMEGDMQDQELVASLMQGHEHSAHWTAARTHTGAAFASWLSRVAEDDDSAANALIPTAEALMSEDAVHPKVDLQQVGFGESVEEGQEETDVVVKVHMRTRSHWRKEKKLCSSGLPMFLGHTPAAQQVSRLLSTSAAAESLGASAAGYLDPLTSAGTPAALLRSALLEACSGKGEGGEAAAVGSACPSELRVQSLGDGVGGNDNQVHSTAAHASKSTESHTAVHNSTMTTTKTLLSLSADKATPAQLGSALTAVATEPVSISKLAHRVAVGEATLSAASIGLPAPFTVAGDVPLMSFMLGVSEEELEKSSATHLQQLGQDLRRTECSGLTGWPAAYCLNELRERFVSKFMSQKVRTSANLLAGGDLDFGLTACPANLRTADSELEAEMDSRGMEALEHVEGLEQDGQSQGQSKATAPSTVPPSGWAAGASHVSYAMRASVETLDAVKALLGSLMQIPATAHGIVPVHITMPQQDLQPYLSALALEWDTSCSGTTEAPGAVMDCEAQDVVDNSEHCEYWAGMGECEKNPDYMKFNCKMSCRVCESRAPPMVYRAMLGDVAVHIYPYTSGLTVGELKMELMGEAEHEVEGLAREGELLLWLADVVRRQPGSSSSHMVWLQPATVLLADPLADILLAKNKVMPKQEDNATSVAEAALRVEAETPVMIISADFDAFEANAPGSLVAVSLQGELPMPEELQKGGPASLTLRAAVSALQEMFPTAVLTSEWSRLVTSEASVLCAAKSGDMTGVWALMPTGATMLMDELTAGHNAGISTAPTSQPSKLLRWAGQVTPSGRGGPLKELWMPSYYVAEMTIWESYDEEDDEE